MMSDAVLSAQLEEITSSVPQFAWDMVRKSLSAAPPGKRCDVCKAELKDGESCGECEKKGGWPKRVPAVSTISGGASSGLFPGQITFR